MGIREPRAKDGMKCTIICVVFASLLVQHSSALIMRTGYAQFLDRLTVAQRDVMIERVAYHIGRSLAIGGDYGPRILTRITLAYRNFSMIFLLTLWNTNTCNLGRGGESKQPIITRNVVEIRTIAMDFLVPSIQSLIRHSFGYGYAIMEGISILHFPAILGPNRSFRVLDNDVQSHHHDGASTALRSLHHQPMISYRRVSLANLSFNGTHLSTSFQTVAPSVAISGEIHSPLTRTAFNDNSTKSSSTNGTTFAHRKLPMDPYGDCEVLSLSLVWADGPDYDDQSGHGPQILNPTDKIWSPNARFFLVMQLDCNLVLYDGKTGLALWSSNTQDKGSTCFATLTSTGELIVYDTYSDNVLYRTNTWCSANGGDCYTYTVLEVQDDGNMVLYIFETGDVLFSSNTVQCEGGCDV